ncbi:'Cold-shock' DNA-binding domain-containing protein [Succinivibrio dextrinosolvens]|uniref:cold-shock protein n=1 Tax=Succinivibrio dextrinosolvens TaxID=83771 RepID=UPI0008E7AF19|nr:cold shock domain-containing protein [Succinivibrio dextrinosolvens]SFS31310.1 'Cold-shock' DNA-binding domain-containing protein [Succinivibrio dextrinosolvens]
MKGKIKFFKEQEGYGFILGEKGEEYYFNVHDIKSFERPPRMGDQAEFNVKASTSENKKDKAVDVVITKADFSEENNRHDDRITCPNCGRKIVPRLVTNQGQAEKSLCPYCGAKVKTFPMSYVQWGVFVILLLVFLIVKFGH